MRTEYLAPHHAPIIAALWLSQRTRSSAPRPIFWHPQVVLEVIDNGGGGHGVHGAATPGGGDGIRGMRERVAALGGIPTTRWRWPDVRELPACACSMLGAPSAGHRPDPRNPTGTASGTNADPSGTPAASAGVARALGRFAPRVDPSRQHVRSPVARWRAHGSLTCGEAHDEARIAGQLVAGGRSMRPRLGVALVVVSSGQRGRPRSPGRLLLGRRARLSPAGPYR
jgi:hypothetical protein